MKGLKHDADVIAAKLRERVLVEALEIGPATSTCPALARSSPPITIINVVLPEPDGPTRPTVSPFAMRERDAAQHVDGARRARQCKTHIIEQNHRLCHAVSLMRRGRSGYGGAESLVNRPCSRRRLGGVWARGAAPAILALGDSMTAGYGLRPRMRCRCGSRRGCRRTASRSRSAMAASRATPPRAGSRGSTG